MRRTRLLGNIIKTFRMDEKGGQYLFIIHGCYIILSAQAVGIEKSLQISYNRREMPLCCIRYDLFIIEMSVSKCLLL